MRSHHFWKNKVSETRATYNAWRDMRARCYNSKTDAYPYYGGRGITVCSRWNEDYDTFVSDMGLKPPQMTLERVDTNGNYDPFNCVWATQAEQARNRRNNVRHEKLSIEADTAKKVGMKLTTLRSRLATGMPLADAIVRPLNALRTRKNSRGGSISGRF